MSDGGLIVLLLAALLALAAALTFLLNKIFAWIREVGPALQQQSVQMSASGSRSAVPDVSWVSERMPLIRSVFSFQGRMTRTNFLVTNVLGVLVAGALSLLGWAIVERAPAVHGLGLLLVFGAILSLVVIGYATSARRMRDTGASVWWVLLLLVPPVNLACAAFLLLVPSDEFTDR